MIFSTQSTHKLLAGLSQASQILVQNSENRELDRAVFNEAYLMHTSTSPQYSIIASCDVAAAMMEAPTGTALVEESICNLAMLGHPNTIWAIRRAAPSLRGPMTPTTPAAETDSGTVHNFVRRTASSLSLPLVKVAPSHWNSTLPICEGATMLPATRITNSSPSP